ncbi:variable surface protein [Plasmodium gonderi]|uniref:Variable surface protein n=1 Tax=Plasmodium gonderi TaxID=77519 RepID=A0A1Y1JPL5_PLAGO|nr:variable surface protein [Plasmodium gonderi]GAW84190.1 variable surface protein [Plasmodium gonderi]
MKEKAIGSITLMSFSLYNAAIKYLYCWIHKNKAEDIRKIKDSYEEVFKIACTRNRIFPFDVFKENNDILNLEILKDLYDMSIEFSNMENHDSCNCDGDKYHCAKKSNDIYNRLRNCDIRLPNILSYAHIKILVVSTSIPIVIILLISFFHFLYMRLIICKFILQNNC